MRSDITERGGAEKSVCHRVKKNVGVGMPLQRGTLRNHHASKLLRAPENFLAVYGEAVRIISEADSHAPMR